MCLSQLNQCNYAGWAAIFFALMLSVVLPIYNEEKGISSFLQEVNESLKNYGKPYELILVNDGSTDNSLDRILSWQQKNMKIKVLSLSKHD